MFWEHGCDDRDHLCFSKILQKHLEASERLTRLYTERETWRFDMGLWACSACPGPPCILLWGNAEERPICWGLYIPLCAWLVFIAKDWGVVFRTPGFATYMEQLVNTKDHIWYDRWDRKPDLLTPTWVCKLQSTRRDSSDDKSKIASKVWICKKLDLQLLKGSKNNCAQEVSKVWLTISKCSNQLWSHVFVEHSLLIRQDLADWCPFAKDIGPYCLSWLWRSRDHVLCCYHPWLLGSHLCQTSLGEWGNWIHAHRLHWKAGADLPWRQWGGSWSSFRGLGIPLRSLGVLDTRNILKWLGSDIGSSGPHSLGICRQVGKLSQHIGCPWSCILHLIYLLGLSKLTWNWAWIWRWMCLIRALQKKQPYGLMIHWAQQLYCIEQMAFALDWTNMQQAL